MRRIYTLLLFTTISLSQVGCASFGKSLKEFLGGDVGKKRALSGQEPKVVGKVDKNKKYRRTDHKTIQERSQLGADSGSLWMERGQGSYLFAQNTNRLIGDLVNVEIKGHPKKQIETKVKVINDLIEKIQAQAEARRLASEKKSPGDKAKSAPKKADAGAGKGEKDSEFDVKIVPSRITEILKDGSYLVKGDQPFMIGKREYKLVVQGIVRQEDFNDQGISSEALLDPKFDIVTNRSKR
jgi:flagellar L-ring protein FlgH